MVHNPNCDGSHCHNEAGEVRALPYGGGGNLILCRACFDHEITFRHERNRELSEEAKFDLPPWQSLNVYGETYEPYCKPWNAGLASETSAVCKRIARLMEALDSELTSNVVKGEIVEDIRQFRFALMNKLEAEGWSLSYDGGNRMKVRPPGHKRPFRKQVVNA